jgi:hypothetical protein
MMDILISDNVQDWPPAAEQQVITGSAVPFPSEEGEF